MSYLRLNAWRAGLLYLLMATLYFAGPIVRGQGVSGADLIYSFGVYQYLAPPDYRPSNTELADQVMQFEPWRKLAQEEIKAGRLPWFNPYAGGGLPLIGNYQSAVFYPTNLLYHVLSDNAASLVSAILRITVACLGTFVLLRSFRILRSVAFLGGLGFGFGGFIICWLGWPHTHVAILLPWNLYFIRLACRSRSSWTKGTLGLSVTVFLELLGGHGPTTFHVGVASLFFMIFLLVAQGRRPAKWYMGPVTRIGFAYTAALALAAFQLLPFVRYLNESAALESRGATRAIER